MSSDETICLLIKFGQNLRAKKTGPNVKDNFIPGNCLAFIGRRYINPLKFASIPADPYNAPTLKAGIWEIGVQAS